jgi:diguanylate cyclase (GGDEF)-like protein
MKVWIAFLALLTLGQIAATLLGRRSFSLTLINDAIQFALMSSIVLVFTINAREGTEKLRLFWMLLAACWGVRIVGQTMWMYFELVLRKEAPNPFVGDILLFLSNIPVLAALLLQPHLDGPERSKSTSRVDFSLLLLWWFYLYLFFVIPWQYVVLDEAKYGWSYDRLNICLDVVLLLTIGFLWNHSAGRRWWFYATFFGAQLLLTVSAFVANEAIDKHLYYPGSWYDLPYSLALVSVSMVGLVGFGRSKITTVANVDGAPLPLSKVGVLAVLSLPVLTALTILTPNTPWPVVEFRVFVALGTVFVMAALLFARQHQLRTELAETNRVFEEASLTDPLTGARNRRFFDATVSSDASHALRSHAFPRAITTHDLIFYMVDLDDFKEVNDRHGHNAGDQVLREVTKRISSVIRHSDVLVRWGGDEFLIVSRHANRADAATFSSRILAAVGSSNVIALGDGSEVRQTCSIGWAAFPWSPDEPDAVPIEAVLGLADRGLYEAKLAGRNRAIGISPSDDSANSFTALVGVHEARYSVQTDCIAGPSPTSTRPYEGVMSMASSQYGQRNENQFKRISETDRVCIYCSEVLRASTPICLGIAEEVHSQFCVAQPQHPLMRG